ncbi:TIGR03546 family protein [Idiomarina xiamenensis]|uniref:DUF2062 domain-containing protein n=1 Tax=Idiomarina xiamenensis 10-D-4 TaxID=740709 RepID=K2KI33_9GAMM|nr:TIGR03546 family protein [Idiomarina xiamenensis]EKE87578.1 hypothetical protein A10D4_00750 [Idiomarina xiamenensis 10-D-4]
MLTLLAKLLKALNSETGAWALAFAFVLGMVLGLTPLWRVHNLIILLAALLFRINLSAFIVSFLVFSGIAYLLDPWFHQIGMSVLQSPSWQGVWETLYASPWGRITQFHHSITMGSIIVSLLFAPILAVLSYLIVINYRGHIQAWLLKLKVVQGLRASRFWQIYAGIRG